MLNQITTQTYITDFLEDLEDGGSLPSGIKIALYAGQIDIIKLAVDAGKFPAILVNWQGDKGGRDYITEEREHGIKFTLLICTDSSAGLAEGMAIVDQLNAELPGEHTSGAGARLFDIYTGPAHPLLNVKLKQVIAYPITCQE